MPKRELTYGPGLDFFLREWRKHRGMTQDRLVEMSGIDKTTISQLENRKVPINERYLISLGRALKCQPIDLLTWNPQVSEIPLEDLVRRVPRHQQALARSMLKALINDDPEAEV